MSHFSSPAEPTVSPLQAGKAPVACNGNCHFPSLFLRVKLSQVNYKKYKKALHITNYAVLLTKGCILGG